MNTKNMLNKVPQVTIFFWIIKVLCTTIGETASDFLNVNLNFGLYGTSVVMGVILAVVLFFQFRAKKYIPGLYWLSVVLISVFGTLITDILTDNLDFPLEASTILFSAALAATFAIWYSQEGTISIHSIYTTRREAFYWLAILFTFALGTAAGDLMAEGLSLGYLVTGLIVLAMIVTVIVAWRLGLDENLSFWIAYILTRPLGASIGDYLSQDPSNGGLGLGAALTSAIFLVAILAVVTYLTVTKYDFDATSEPVMVEAKSGQAPLIWRQVVGVVMVLLVLSVGGYYWRSTQLSMIETAHASSVTPLGDLSNFRQITTDTQNFVQANDLAGARTRITDLETAWDNAQPTLKPMNPAKWSTMDGDIDGALKCLRASQPHLTECATPLQTLLNEIDSLDPQNG
ncbi:MAG: hypothetical protein H6631_11320 [Anaerolineaceae bacterium]|nr:hypothetical protein [Anaerolineaceae bacterium]MCB9102258.1 hypothetical protein [Anaerolineales bacterium]